jgi:putative endonuclease
MAWVYILKTQSGKLYVGSTSDLDERISHHKGGFTPSTKRLGNPELIFSQEYRTLKDARFVELRLKKLRSRVYIDRIIQDGKIKITPP